MSLFGAEVPKRRTKEEFGAGLAMAPRHFAGISRGAIEWQIVRRYSIHELACRR